MPALSTRTEETEPAEPSKYAVGALNPNEVVCTNISLQNCC
jgi:hypothetical protein